MDPAERANLPRWSGRPGFFEIWFAAIFDPAARRAYWLRYTILSPRPGYGDGAAIVWAAAFDAESTEPVVWGKRILPLAAANLGPRDRFEVRMASVGVADAVVAHGRLEGSVEAGGHSLAWRLLFDPARTPVRRAPRLFEYLPMPAQAEYAHDRVRFEGEVVIDGERRQLQGALGLQAHIRGTHQIDEIGWVHTHALHDTHGRPGHVEIVSARVRRTGPARLVPRMISMLVEHDGATWSDSGLLDVTEPELTQPRPGLLDIRSVKATRAMHVRAWAEPEQMAGYVYRDPQGHEAYVAQSDIAFCEVEVMKRAHPFARFRPEARLFSRGRSGLEIHAPVPLEGVRYIPWEETAPPARPFSPRRARPPTPKPEEAGEVVPLLAPKRIFALGLTYDDHARETGNAARTEVFEKPLSTWLPVSGGEAEVHVRLPGNEDLDRALEQLEPGLSGRLRATRSIVPLLMDYEVELGVVLLEDVPRARLLAASTAASEEASPRLAFFVANDLTARALQILGEGTSAPLRYWSAAKGFPGFLPVGATMWAPARPSLRAFPRVLLTTRVDGNLRQATFTDRLRLTPREALLAVADAAGHDLERGDVILTGTPSGIALQVPAWKRKLGDLLLDRFGKLDAVIASTARPDAFLRPGERVECGAGFLGTCAVTLDEA